ncbi:MAG: hypothetical protein ABI600_17840 [Luteolibacter sp.]
MINDTVRGESLLQDHLHQFGLLAHIFEELADGGFIKFRLMFVVADLGRPDRFWHMMPFIGKFNGPFPCSPETSRGGI